MDALPLNARKPAGPRPSEHSYPNSSWSTLTPESKRKQCTPVPSSKFSSLLGSRVKPSWPLCRCRGTRIAEVRDHRPAPPAPRIETSSHGTDHVPRRHWLSNEKTCAPGDYLTTRDSPQFQSAIPKGASLILYIDSTQWGTSQYCIRLRPLLLMTGQKGRPGAVEPEQPLRPGL